MRFKFDSILEDDMYSSARVILVTGPYNFFNNLVINKMKGICEREKVTIKSNIDISEEFGVDNGEENNTTSVNLSTFESVVHTPNINGRWFCVCDYSNISTKQKGFLERYMRSPNDNGILIVYANEYKDYRDIIRRPLFNSSRVTHHINLSYADRDTLRKIVNITINDKGKAIEQNALDYVILKVNKAYDDIDVITDRLVENTYGEVINIENTKNILKGVENFTVEDFVIELTKPVTSCKANKKKIYRIMSAMIEQYGTSSLVHRLKTEIDTYIEFRMYINNGTIPVTINYFFSDAIKDIDENSKLKKMKEYTFRKKASIAAQTSLRDWHYMMLILNSAGEYHDENKEKRALYELCSRAILGQSRLNNIIGIEDIIERNYSTLNKFKYRDRAVLKDYE